MSTEETKTTLGEKPQEVAKPQFKVKSSKGFSETFDKEEKAYASYNKMKEKYEKMKIPFRLTLKQRDDKFSEWAELEETVRTERFFEED